jgi:hypothetical protein
MNRQQGLRAAWAACQHGQIIILTVVILALGSGFLIYSMASPRATTAQKNAETDAALAQVKQALIGWSASRAPGSPNVRPGELPCPDMNDNGMDDDGTCFPGAIGRVPWQALGIPRPLDGNGETIWYAVAGPFRYKNMNPQPITSDTLGNLVVYQDSSATTLTSQAIAVVFAPGPPLGTQARGTTTAPCSTTGTTIQQRNCAANYLESTGGVNNAQTGGPFVQSTCRSLNTGASSCPPASATFNDRVLAITNADLMPLVEQRVAREMMALLWQYKNATGVYPWADLYDGDSNGNPFLDADNRARFPCGNALPVDWGALFPPITLPDWLTNGCPDPGSGVVDGWSALIYYAVAENRLQNSGSGCTTCSGSTLNVINTGFAYLCTIAPVPFSCTWGSVPIGTADVILITPGASDGSPRNWPMSFSSITGYFDDAENRDNNDDNYRIPATSDNPNRDRMFIVR